MIYEFYINHADIAKGVRAILQAERRGWKSASANDCVRTQSFALFDAKSVCLLIICACNDSPHSQVANGVYMHYAYTCVYLLTCEYEKTQPNFVFFTLKPFRNLPGNLLRLCFN